MMCDIVNFKMFNKKYSQSYKMIFFIVDYILQICENTYTFYENHKNNLYKLTCGLFFEMMNALYVVGEFII